MIKWLQEGGERERARNRSNGQTKAHRRVKLNKKKCVWQFSNHFPFKNSFPLIIIMRNTRYHASKKGNFKDYIKFRSLFFFSCFRPFRLFQVYTHTSDYTQILNSSYRIQFELFGRQLQGKGKKVERKESKKDEDDKEITLHGKYTNTYFLFQNSLFLQRKKPHLIAIPRTRFPFQLQQCYSKLLFLCILNDSLLILEIHGDSKLHNYSPLYFSVGDGNSGK